MRPKSETQDLEDAQGEIKGFETPAEEKAAKALAHEYRKAIAVHSEATRDLKAKRDKIRDYMRDKGIGAFKHDGRIYKLEEGEVELVIEKVAEPKADDGGKKGRGGKAMEETVRETEDEGRPGERE